MKNALGMKSTGFKLWKIAAVAGACMALAVFGGTTAAFPQSVPASEGCQGPEMPRFDDCQRLEGSWLYTVTIPNPSGAPIVFQGVETYAAGGGYSEADQLSFTPGYLATAGHGAWRLTGERTFLLTYVNLTYDAGGNATGTSKVRQTTRLDHQGKTYSGSGDFTYYDLNGKVVAAGTFTITAQRILVQAPQ
jgi:hypothetical protein